MYTKYAKTMKRTNPSYFSEQKVPFDIYYNATAVLRNGYVYKQCKNQSQQVYIEECNTLMQKASNVICPCDRDNDG